MQCPYCGQATSCVVDSRDADSGQSIRRRRQCESCDKRFTSYERVEGIDLKIIKKDGTREDYDREKLRRGIVKATWKRPVSMSEIEDLITQVEQQLRLKTSREIKSWEVGNLVIERLRQIDKLSYLLFASVYRDFESLEDFEAELASLKTTNDVTRKDV